MRFKVHADVGSLQCRHFKRMSLQCINLKKSSWITVETRKVNFRIFRAIDDIRNFFQTHALAEVYTLEIFVCSKQSQYYRSYRFFNKNCEKNPISC